MGAVAGYLASNPTVTISSETYSNGSSQRYTYADLARDDVSHLVAVLEVALREAMTQYEVRVKDDIRNKGRPRYFYTVSVNITSIGALDLNEWEQRVDATWNRVMQWREEHHIAKNWKRVEAFSLATSDFINGKSVSFDFRIYHELANA